MKYEPRGVTCREAVNECDVPETCTGDSSQVSWGNYKEYDLRVDGGGVGDSIVTF